MKIFFYHTRYKIPFSEKNFYINFNRINGYIKEYNGRKYLTSITTDKKTNPKDNNSDHSDDRYMKVQIKSDDDLPTKKLIMHNVSCGVTY